MAKPPHPSLRTIAGAAGVCPMTVSLALRAHPSIPAVTRLRIQRLARTQGYRPDPTVAKLMRHLGTRRSARFRANLCALTPALPFVRPQGYLDRMLRSLRERADSLGYGFSIINLDDYAGPRSRLRRVLRGRGVEGIILTPMSEPRDLSPVLNWDEFSVVSVTPSVLQPHFHSVSPNHYDNMRCVCHELTQSGYRRIGLAIPADRDLRVRHRWSGAIAWHNLYGGATPIPPLIDESSGTDLDRARLRSWLGEYRPDVVVTDLVEEVLAETIRTALPPRSRPGIVGMSWPKPFADAGIDQKVEDIGVSAVELLAGMIQHGEKGAPETPRTTMVDGKWMQGSLPTAPSGRRFKNPASPPDGGLAAIAPGTPPSVRSRPFQSG